MPRAASETRTLYASAKTGTKKAYAKMKATAKHNAKAVRNFVAQKLDTLQNQQNYTTLLVKMLSKKVYKEVEIQ